jgi:hypothetical protein
MNQLPAISARTLIGPDPSGLAEHVIAYRSLGKANYDFAAVARDYAIKNAPCLALCFDIRGFFDNLDHKLLKSRLKRILEVDELSKDWFAVYREVTRHKWIEREHLAADPAFGPRLRAPNGRPVATISEVKKAKISIFENANAFGIPQGTPISSVFANLYMMDFDRDLSMVCKKLGALYQRYSDDILIVCKEADRSEIVKALELSLLAQKLNLSPDKTEEVLVKSGDEDPFQYLGFYISYGKVYLRSPSIGRQWRKLRRNIRRAKKVGELAVKNGSATKVFTKRLRAKFSPVGTQNFSSYARKAADALGANQIRKQVRRLERAADKAIRDLNK